MQEDILRQAESVAAAAWQSHEEERVVCRWAIGSARISIVQDVQAGYGVYVTSGRKTHHIDTSYSFREARKIAQRAMKVILEERASNGPPTDTQLGILFGMRIPIPLDLTFSQAHDLIESTLRKKGAAN